MKNTVAVLKWNVLFVMLLANLNSSAQPLQFNWVIPAGSEQLSAVTTDVYNNVYVAGYFGGTVDFDPGPGTANLVATGGLDAFIAKYNASGQYVWAIALNGPGTEICLDITVDANGNVYVVGQFSSGATDFDPGAGTFSLTPAGAGDGFVAKYNASGGLVWAFPIGGTANIDDGLSSIELDAGGNVVVAGHIAGPTVDVDPGPGSVILTSNGTKDLFVAKYTAGGNYIWAKNAGSNWVEIAYGMALDDNGNIFLTGIFYYTSDFDPGPGTANLTTASVGSEEDGFLLKYDASGNYLWALGIGGAHQDYGLDVAVDADGNAYATGFFNSTADFDPGPGVQNRTAGGISDGYLAKYSASGAFLWATNLGGSTSDKGNCLTTNAQGDVWVSGYFSGSNIDFDPGAGAALLSALGGDIFLAKYNSNGDYQWAYNIGGTSSEEGNAIAIRPNGNLWLGGRFQGTADFDPGAGAANLTSSGAYDGFLAKYVDTEEAGGIELGGNGNPIPNRSMAPDPDNGTDYGPVMVGQSSNEVFALGNNSNSVPLNLTGFPLVTLAGQHASDFTVTALPSTPVAPGGGTTFAVQFQPSAPGYRWAIVIISHDDFAENPFVFMVSGVGQ